MLLQNPFIKEDKYEKARFFLLAIILLSLAFSVRFINSIALIMLVAITLLHPKRGSFIKRAFSDAYFLCCLLLFLLKAVGVLYTTYVDETIKQIGGKTIWLAIPFFFCGNYGIPSQATKKLLLYFSIALLIVCIYCLINALFAYLRQDDLSVFFYHELVRPFKHHAIFFSFYLFFCIVYWLEKGIGSFKSARTNWALALLVVFFFLFIILLSSKLVVIISIVYFLYVLFRKLIERKAKLVLALAIAVFIGLITLVITTNNPVGNRFSDALDGSISLFKQDNFSPATYFNGVQLRLLIWRFTYEIIDEKNAWLLGVSSGDAQHELDRKYEEVNVYLGNGITDTKGYKAFNCHNVFLQTSLESGLAGLFTLLLLIIVFLWKAVKKKDSFTLIFYLGILAFCFTESVLTSQYTILLFMFFPLLGLKTRAGTCLTDTSS